jgi:hypothetical protein
MYDSVSFIPSATLYALDGQHSEKSVSLAQGSSQLLPSPYGLCV